MNRLARLAIAAAAALAATAPAAAQTDINLWHALPSEHNHVILSVVAEFNATQREYRIVSTYKGGYPDTMNAGLAASRAGNPPHILQVFEVGTATMMAAKGAIRPVHELMKDVGEPFDPAAYLPAISGYYSTSSGEMLSFPFNSSSIVMWVNRDALRKAAIDPASLKTWPEVFEAAKSLKNAGYRSCGFSTAWTTWANLEQFSAWHGVPLATRANGLDGFDATLQINGPLQVRHLQRLAELQKDKTFDYSGRTHVGEGRFTSGECPIFLTSSAFYSSVKANAKFDWAALPIPYYPDAAGAPQNTIIGGASLWVMSGKTTNDYKGVARFFSFLSSTERQARMHQVSGYLPVTRAAYQATKEAGFYDRNPSLHTPLLELTNKEPTVHSRGLRLGSMAQLRDIWADEIEAALAGQKTAKQALDDGVVRGDRLLREFERGVAK